MTQKEAEAIILKAKQNEEEKGDFCRRTNCKSCEHFEECQKANEACVYLYNNGNISYHFDGAKTLTVGRFKNTNSRKEMER